jgi:hypothetical protein
MMRESRPSHVSVETHTSVCSPQAYKPYTRISPANTTAGGIKYLDPYKFNTSSLKLQQTKIQVT